MRTLPCVMSFVGGVAVDRVVGFDELGAKDDFPTAVLETRLITSGAVKLTVVHKGDGDGDGDHERTVRKGFASQAMKQTESDEDSDFD